MENLPPNSPDDIDLNLYLRPPGPTTVRSPAPLRPAAALPSPLASPISQDPPIRSPLAATELRSPVASPVSHQDPLLRPPPASPIRSPLAGTALRSPVASPVSHQDTVKSVIITPPFIWASDRRAQIRDVRFIRSQAIEHVHLDVKCMECKEKFAMQYQWNTKMTENHQVLSANKTYEVPETPEAALYWLCPTPTLCPRCNKDTILVPQNAKKKRNLNWFGLLVANELGSLNFDQLIYFCKHNRIQWRNHSKAQLIAGVRKILIYQLMRPYVHQKIKK